MNGYYEALLAAADVEPLLIDVNEFQKVLGHSSVQSFLFGMRVGKKFAETRAVDTFNNSWITSQTGFDQPTDFGINRLPNPFPEGYQNQTITINGKKVPFTCWCPPPPNPWAAPIRGTE